MSLPMNPSAIGDAFMPPLVLYITPTPEKLRKTPSTSYHLPPTAGASSTQLQPCWLTMFDCAEKENPATLVFFAFSFGAPDSPRMKIKNAREGVLTNFEVLDLLRSRGATTDPLAALDAVSPSECKVFDYLMKSAVCNQTREIIKEFLERSEQYNLAKAEKLNIINIRPSTTAEIFPIIEECEERLDDGKLEELVNLVVEVLPPAPQRQEAEQEGQ